MRPFGNSMMMGHKSGFNPNTPLGTFVQGGYYIGTIVDDGQTWALIVAPKASGETTGYAIKTSRTSSGATSSTNGPSNTAIMAGPNHPAANWVRSLAINGKSDWYIPARNELTVIYNNRNLLPSLERLIDNDNAAFYRTSTQLSSDAWTRRFTDGNEVNRNQTLTVDPIRAIRRVLIG